MTRRFRRTIGRLASVFGFVCNAAFAALVAAVALPGPQRVVLPEAYGLTAIAPRTWTDAPKRASDFLALAETARGRVSGFFGDAPPDPSIVFCSTRACARAFGIGGNGASFAEVAILLSPGGLTVGTLTHEMTHSRLHRSMGLRNLVRQPYPTWFDEGLATHVADHPVWNGQVTQAARERVRQVRRVWQWDDAYRALGAGLAYRSAAAEVAEIEREIGHAGLLELIARAEAGERFDSVLAELTHR